MPMKHWYMQKWIVDKTSTWPRLTLRHWYTHGTSTRYRMFLRRFDIWNIRICKTLLFIYPWTYIHDTKWFYIIVNIPMKHLRDPEWFYIIVSIPMKHLRDSEWLYIIVNIYKPIFRHFDVSTISKSVKGHGQRTMWTETICN